MTRMMIKIMMMMKMTKMILIDDDDVNANNKYAFIFIKCVPKWWWEGMVGKKGFSLIYSITHGFHV